MLRIFIFFWRPPPYPCFLISCRIFHDPVLYYSINTSKLFDILKNRTLGLHGYDIFLINRPRWEHNPFLPQDFVIINDVIIYTFLQNERIIPQLNKIQHLRLYFIPIIRIRPDILQETGLPPQLHYNLLTRFSNPNILLWNDYLFAAWWKFLLQFFTKNSSIFIGKNHTSTPSNIFPLFYLLYTYYNMVITLWHSK